MGKTRYQRIAQMLNNIKLNHGNIIDLELLQTSFLIHIGADMRTKREGIKQMLELKMIEELDNGRVKIN